MGTSISAFRSHEFCYGHRVVGHEGKCKGFHGHNGCVKFYVDPEKDLDSVGRVVDFSVIKDKLCQWLEDNWDHKMLLSSQDPLLRLFHPPNIPYTDSDYATCFDSVVEVPFNPTAENMATHLLKVVGPKVFKDLPITLVSVEFYETSKCGVVVNL